MIRFLIALLTSLPFTTFAQELYTFTEPASNMAARSIGLRLNNRLFTSADNGKMFQLNPEIMWGVSRNIMIHGDAYFTDNGGYSGASVYIKYRVFSIDDVHNHFRVAVFGRLSDATNTAGNGGIDLNGMNEGYELGTVATKLVNKVAVSINASYLRSTDKISNGLQKQFSPQAIGYSFSAGRLMLPKEYTDYKQTNMNLMLEFLGQTDIENGATFIDAAPSVQFIFLSKMRLDLGYRFKIAGNAERMYDRNFLLRLEYNLFNAYK